MTQSTDNPRNINLSISLTETEAHMLQACADDLKISCTEAVVKGVKLLLINNALIQH